MKPWWLLIAGLTLIATGIYLEQPLLAIAGIGAWVLGWTHVHQPFADRLRGLLSTFIAGDGPLLITTAIGVLLLYVGVSMAKHMGLTLVGASLLVIGVSRVGFRLRLWAAGRASHWPMLGGLLLVPAVLALIRIGVSPLMSLIIVGLILAFVWLVIANGRARVVTGTVLGLIVWVSSWLFAQPGGVSSPDPNDGASSVLVAMGDSFMSGEGAREYIDGTNVHGENECRRAESAYALIVAEQRKMDLEFFACSGARTANVTETEQFAGMGRQIDLLRGVSSRLGPKSAVLVSIGGNDAGFGEIGRTCLVPGSCAIWGEQWVRSIRDEVQTKITLVHRVIRRSVPDDVPVFAVTYPVVLKPTTCFWSPLSDEEHSFLANQLTVDLNDAVKQASEVAGINVIDLEAVLEQHEVRICDRADPQAAAVNVIGLGPVEGSLWDRVNPQNWFHGSLHPNPSGHGVLVAAIDEAIEAKQNRIEAGESPNPDPTEPSAGRGSPFLRLGEDPESFTELSAAVVANHGGNCSAEYSSTRSLGFFVDTSEIDETGVQRVYGAAPSSLACLHDANGTWTQLEVSESGVLQVPWAFPETQDPIRAFYRTADDQTIVVEVIFCHITPTSCPGSGTASWVAGQLRLLVFGVGLPVWALAFIGANLALGSFGSIPDGGTPSPWRGQVLRGPSSSLMGDSPLRKSMNKSTRD